jgi:hypothetical protein
MGTVDLQLAGDLARLANVRRAVETGTYRGGTTRKLAGLFPSVVTIEISEKLHREAVERLKDLPGVDARHGHSAQVLTDVRLSEAPTLYYLDGHWSAGSTGGEEDQCPVLGEIAAIGPGHPDDFLIIDDARLFTSAPEAPMDPAKWPTLTEVFDALRAQRPEHLVTVLNDQIISYSPRVQPAIDAYGDRLRENSMTVVSRAKLAAFNVRERVLASRR